MISCDIYEIRGFVNSSKIVQKRFFRSSEPDAFAFAGEFGFAGVDGDGGHGVAPLGMFYQIISQSITNTKGKATISK